MQSFRVKIQEIGPFDIPNGEYGDLKLNVFPFKNNGRKICLPEGFRAWEDSLNEIVSKHIPPYEGANTHYVTIDSKFFSKEGFLRREGIHIDGNFCADPLWERTTWGGIEYVKFWEGVQLIKGKIIKDWELPYDIKIPLGTYASDRLGGMFCVSTEVGCEAWGGNFDNLKIWDEGEVVNEEGKDGKLENNPDSDCKTTLKKDTLYFMSSCTPHRTLKTEKGKRRTLMRITLNHQYPTWKIPCLGYK